MARGRRPALRGDRIFGIILEAPNHRLRFMTDETLIPAVQIHSGDKFVNDKGITAIKDGIKSSRQGGDASREDPMRLNPRVPSQPAAQLQ